MKKSKLLKNLISIKIMLTALLCLGTFANVQAQTVQWMYGPPSVDRPMINLTAEEYGAVTADFMLRSKSVNNAKTQIAFLLKNRIKTIK